MAQFGSRHSVYREVHLVPDAGIQGLCYLFPLLGSSIVWFFSPCNLALALLFVFWIHLLSGRLTLQVLAHWAVLGAAGGSQGPRLLLALLQEVMGFGAPAPGGGFPVLQKVMVAVGEHRRGASPCGSQHECS